MSAAAGGYTVITKNNFVVWDDINYPSIVILSSNKYTYPFYILFGRDIYSGNYNVQSGYNDAKHVVGFVGYCSDPSKSMVHYNSSIPQVMDRIVYRRSLTSASDCSYGTWFSSSEDIDYDGTTDCRFTYDCVVGAYNCAIGRDNLQGCFSKVLLCTEN